jgi:hypothetical protein
VLYAYDKAGRDLTHMPANASLLCPPDCPNEDISLSDSNSLPE